jgi:sec-independent protein translocase protein TatA
MGGLRGWEWIIIAVLVVGIFGLPKLPSVAKSIGQSLRILRDEAKGVTGDAEGGGDGAAGDGTGGDGTAGDGTAGDGTVGDGSAGDGKARGKA